MKNQGGTRCLLKKIKERKQTGLFLTNNNRGDQCFLMVGKMTKNAMWKN